MMRGIQCHPLVSATIIFLNAERFFREAIESVIGQTYRDWELWLVDDGSVDRSPEIAQDYARRLPDRIRYLSHPHRGHRGTSASRNLGIQHSRGDLTAFLDSDDIWVPHKLEEQVAVLQKHPDAVLSYGPTRIWHSWAGDAAREPDWWTYHGPNVDQLVPAPQLLELLMADEFTVPSTCSIVIRTDAIRTVGAFEETFAGQLEDMVLYTKLFLEYAAHVSSQCWGWYRQHDRNSSKEAMANGTWLPHEPNPARRAYLLWCEAYLRERGIRQQVLTDLLQRELLPYLSDPDQAGGAN